MDDECGLGVVVKVHAAGEFQCGAGLQAELVSVRSYRFRFRLAVAVDVGTARQRSVSYGWW